MGNYFNELRWVGMREQRRFKSVWSKYWLPALRKTGPVATYTHRAPIDENAQAGLSLR